MTALLQAQHLSRAFIARRGGLFRRPRCFNAVDDVSLSVQRHETLAIVGESGCGKSTLAKLLLGLLAPTAGEVLLEGQPVGHADDAAWRALRRRLQLVFQDTVGSLDPRLPVLAQVREALDIHDLGTPPERDGRASAMLEAVRLGSHLWQRVPGELSGGQQQRVIIARALVLEPELLICDEPVAALDVSIQAQVINLLMDLQQRLRVAMVFISHDLAVVRYIAHRVGVMYLGRLVELGDTRAVFEHPRHPYTRALISAIPVPDPTAPRERLLLPGDPPSPTAPPPGCRFHTRCSHASEICRRDGPPLRDLDGRSVACHHAETIA